MHKSHLVQQLLLNAQLRMEAERDALPILHVQHHAGALVKAADLTNEQVKAGGLNSVKTLSFQARAKVNAQSDVLEVLACIGVCKKERARVAWQMCAWQNKSHTPN